MKRRGQLLSIDALLSLVIVVMVVGVVMNTNDMIRAEITNLLDWYDRANIANNMLDVLTKNPGYPEDWEKNVGNVRVLGLRDEKFLFALDYEKILALNKSKDNLTEIFNQLARGKDFLLEVYISSITLNISGRFPRVYLDNITLSGERGSQNINFEIRNAASGNPRFTVINITLERGGNIYVNEEVCDIISNPQNRFEVGDLIKIISAEPVEIWAQLHGEQFSKILPAGTVIEIEILDKKSNIDLYDNNDNCYTYAHVTGRGQVLIRIFAYDATLPVISSVYVSARDFLEKAIPLYWFALINGTFESDMDKVYGSMLNSPWIEPVERRAVFMRPNYNLSAGPSKEDPIVYGFMKYNALGGEVLRIGVNSSSYGNLTLITQLGTEVRGLFLYGNQSELNATLVWYEEGVPKLKGYKGTDGFVIIPFKELFGSTNTQNRIIIMWLYSLEGWRREDVQLQFVPDIRYMIEPKFEETIIKLWVWDDS